MPNVAPCRGCGVSVDCLELRDPKYSLERTILPFDLFCPTGVDCFTPEDVTVSCCDGSQILVHIPLGSDPVRRFELIAQAFADCSMTCPDPPLVFYYNNPKICTAQCPDGTTFTATTPGGTVVASSQAEADIIAQQFACNNVAAYKFCLGPLDTCICCNVPASMVIATEGREQITWSVIAGSMPPGMSLNLALQLAV